MAKKKKNNTFNFKELWDSAAAARKLKEEKDKKKEFDASPAGQYRIQQELKQQQAAVLPTVDPNKPEEKKSMKSWENPDKKLGVEQAKEDIGRAKASGGTSLSEARQQEVQQRSQTNQTLLAQAQQGQVTPEQLQNVQGANIDWGQAIGSGVTNMIPSVIGGAGAGAISGAAGGPIGAIGGAAIGAVGGFLNSVKNSIKSEQAEEFASDQAALTKGQRYLNTLITDTNKNPQNAAQNIELFYKTMNMIDYAHARTFKDSQENLNVWLGNDASVELSKFEIFDATLRQSYEAKFQMALMQPNPNIMFTDDEINDIQAFSDLEGE